MLRPLGSSALLRRQGSVRSIKSTNILLNSSDRSQSQICHYNAYYSSEQYSSEAPRSQSRFRLVNTSSRSLHTSKSPDETGDVGLSDLIDNSTDSGYLSPTSPALQHLSTEQRIAFLNATVAPKLREQNQKTPRITSTDFDALIPDLNDEKQVEKLKDEIMREKASRYGDAASSAPPVKDPKMFANEKTDGISEDIKKGIDEDVNTLLSTMQMEESEGEDVHPADVDMDGPVMDHSNILELSRAILLEKSMYKPLESRPVMWHGVGDSVALPPLPNRKKRITELDWRTFLNLRHPHLWYPLARVLNRKIYIHCGPTNSGKTYSAMKRLAEAETGLFCGPLRLLAWEVHDKLNKQNVPCSLLTGQEIVEIPNANHISSTVEMCNLERVVDVAVIDEIQMIQDQGRGNAWTRALLGIPAREIHLCGDETSLNWILEMTKITGEEVVVNKYNRLSPVSVQDNIVTSLKYLKKGDCVICFGRKDIYWLKDKIEKETGKKVAIIYGNLPPAVRKLQADLFNDPNSGVDILVASDAIGMGLNLQIGRVVFSTVIKFDGEEYRKLNMTEIKQIGGRAGRFNSEYNHGWVTAMYSMEDLQHIKENFNGVLPPMEKARLSPSSEHLLLFCHKFPHIPFSSYLRNLQERSKIDKRYELVDITAMIEVAENIDEYPLDAYARIMLCFAPFSITRFSSHSTLLKHYAERLCEEEPVPIPSMAYITQPGVPSDPSGIAKLEETYSNLDTYVWLAYRFGERRFPSMAAAQRDRALVAELIHTSLTKLSGSTRSGTIRVEQADGTVTEAKVKVGDRIPDVRDRSAAAAGPKKKSFESDTRTRKKTVKVHDNAPTGAATRVPPAVPEGVTDADYADVDQSSAMVSSSLRAGSVFAKPASQRAGELDGIVGAVMGRSLKDYQNEINGSKDSYGRLLKGKQ